MISDAQRSVYCTAACSELIAASSTAFAIAIVLTWADALLEVMTDALDTWKLGTAKIIGALVVTAFCLFGVMFLSILFDFYGHKIAPSN